MHNSTIPSYDFISKSEAGRIDGDEVFRAIRQGATDQIAVFIKKFGVDKTFSFEYDISASADMSRGTILLAALYAKNDEIANMALEHGAQPIVGHSIVHSVGLSNDVHPFAVAISNRQTEASLSMWNRGVDLETMVAGSDGTFSYHHNLAHEIANDDGAVTFLESIGLNDVAALIEVHSTPPNKRRSIQP